LPDEIVTIRIDFEANRRDMAQVLAEIQGFTEAVDAANDSTNRFTQSTNRLNRTVRNADEPLAAMRRRTDSLEKSGKNLGRRMVQNNKLMTMFRKVARLLFFQLIALAAEFVITAATLASVNLLFKTGQLVAKGYNLALGAVGAALATVAVAATTAVAAFREFNAAAAAWQYKGANIYGSATGAAAAAMRGLYSDTNLATMGVVNLTQAYKSMSQQGRVTGAQTKALSGAMDFTARSQDQAKSFQAMANFVAVLQKEGKVTGKASTAASGVSKEFAEAIKKSKGKDAQSIMASMASGKLAQQAGVSGEFGSIKGTLVAQFKQITVALTQDMADFGEQFLNDTRRVLDGLFKNVRNVFARLAPEFTFFGKNKLFPAITTIGNALERFSVTLVRKYLPMLFGASQWFKRTSASFMKSFNQFKNSLEKFREGSRIINETFKGPLLAIFRIFGRNAEQLGYLAEDNEEQFTAWGSALERLIFAIGDWFAALKVAFTEALPVLTGIVDILTKLINGMASLVRGIGTFKLGGGEGFLGMGGSGGGPSGTVGGGLGPGIGSLVTLGLLFGGFRGSRTAYRIRRAGRGTVGDAMDQASVFGASMAPRGIFGGIPAIFSPKRYSRARGNQRLTPGEVAASYAHEQKLKDQGRSHHDPFAIRDGFLMRGAETMGTGRKAAMFASNRFERTGFASQADFATYMGVAPSGIGSLITTTGPMAGTVASKRLLQAVEASDASVKAIPGFSGFNQNKQLKLLEQGRDEARRTAMREATAGRDLRLGTGGVGFRGIFKQFRTSDVTADAGEGVTLSSQREGLFRTLSGRRMQEQIKGADDFAANMTATTSPLMARPSELAIARQKAFKEFLERDRTAGGRKFVDADGRLDARRERAAYRAFARQEFKGRAGVMFRGTGEAAQASLRKTFNPMMGMMGGMVLSTGVTNRIGDKETRAAVNNALGIGAMFGGRGMAVAAGLTLMKSESTGKAMAGGAMAGAAVGKTVSDMLTPMLGPAGPLAKAMIIGGGALIGGAVGVFKAHGNRLKSARKTGVSIAERLSGLVVASMLGAEVDPKTGRLVQSKDGSSYLRGANAVARQRKMVQDIDFGGPRADILASLKATGALSGSETKKLEGYLTDIAGGGGKGSNAADYFDETINEFRKKFGGGRTAEDFFGTGRRGERVRGSIFVPEEGLGTNEAADIMMKRGNFVIKHLTKITGMTERELMELASKMDVDLHDPTKSLTETMGLLGKATRRAAEEIKAAIRDLNVTSLNVFDEEIKARAETEAFTASKNRLMGLGGTATIEDFRDYARLLVSTTERDNPNNQFAVLDAMRDFSEGNLGLFGKMDPALLGAFAKNGKAQAGEAYRTQLSGISDIATQQALGGFAERGFVLQDPTQALKLQETFRTIFGRQDISSQDKSKLLNFLETGQLVDKNKNFQLDALRNLGGAGQALAQALGGSGGRQGAFALETDKVYQIEGEVKFDDDTRKIFEDMNKAVKQAFDTKPEMWENDAPQWWNSMLNARWEVSGNTLKLVQDDTKTPRRGQVGDTATSRALRGTMSAHARFNSLLTGKRSVTSSLRFDNLGSPSSDHAAGRAYDLVGQNLGQYQKLIAGAGGFAEFHGWGSSRHLHVVPPIGNTYSPRSATLPGAAGTMNQTVTLNVYPAPGQSETAIAKQVVAALEAQQRAYRERT